jgi:CheY-like chemotaxis protein
LASFHINGDSDATGTRRYWVFDGLDAVQQAQQLQPDLILLDGGLPGLHGVEVARRIRNVSRTSKILFASANLSPDIAEEALSTGASGYMVKSDAASGCGQL